METKPSLLSNRDSVQLQESISTVDYFIRRDYLSNLSCCEVIPSKLQDPRRLRLFKINKLIFNSNENVNDKLISVYSSLQNVGASVFLLIKGDADNVSFYIGVSTDESAAISGDVLANSFEANFPGSQLHSLNSNEIQKCIQEQNFTNICSVTVVPSTRDTDKEKFVQGMEKFIDTMRGKKYSAMFLARPIPTKMLHERRTSLERLYSALSPYAKTSLAYGENQSAAISEGVFENFSSTVNESIATALGETWSISDGSSKSRSGWFTDYSTNKSDTYGSSYTETHSRGTSETTGSGTNKSKTDTRGVSTTLTKESTDKTVDNTLQYIDQQLERIKQCESFGIWETSAYFCSGGVDVSVIAASTFKALVSGEDTNAENAFLNVWDGKNNYTPAVAEHLKNCRHPIFIIDSQGEFREQFVTPGNFLSSKELPLVLGLPLKSVAGLPVSTIADFNRNVTYTTPEGTSSERNMLRLGCVYHMGIPETSNKVELDVNSFASHCFITGSTGSGKSNTTYCILQNFIRARIPFLVIEPAKGEYKNEFGGLEGINIFTTNPNMGAMLKINPFEFHPNIHILEHLDRLIEIFNACWEMYAAMPAILKSAIEKAYTDKGWDLLNSIYVRPGQPIYPTFSDVLNALPQIISSTSYSSDSKGDYTGALVTRVQSLTNGITGQIFCDNYAINDSILFDQNTIIDLSRIGSIETKSLIMGILVMKLSEYRMATTTGSNQELRHITVLEEAHNLLKNVNKSQNQQPANLVGKSVEMICNSIAEMRTYGEGFIIVDQSPTSVDITAIKNTNTKIVMRLPEKGDCEAIGSSLGLNEEQIIELSKLPVGVGAVLQNNWLGAVLCNVNKAHTRFYKASETNTFEQIKTLRSAVLESMLVQFSNDKHLNYDQLKDVILAVNIAPPAKKEMIDRVNFICTSLEKLTDENERYSFYYQSILHLSGMLGVFASCESYIQKRETDLVAINVWKKQLLLQMRRLLTFSNDNAYEFLFKRLLYSMRSHSTNISYAEIYRTLYRKE